MNRRKPRRIPLEDRIRQMRSRVQKSQNEEEDWRKCCARKGLYRIGLQEYQAGLRKILGESSYAKELQDLGSLPGYQENESLCGFFEDFCPFENEKEWYQQVYQCLILPFSRMSQKVSERWMEVGKEGDVPFDGLPFD